MGGVEFVGFEAKFLVNRLSDRIALKDFEGDFAAIVFAGDFFDAVEEFQGETLSSKCREDGEVVDVEERLEFESRETEKAIGEASELAVEVTEEAEGVRDFAEFAGEIVTDLGIEGMINAHRVAGVGI